MVCVIAMMEGTGDFVSSCTYTGNSMTKRVGVTSSPSPVQQIEIWELSDEKDGYSSIPEVANSVVVDFFDSTSAWNVNISCKY
jgi:hypothetical protein